MIALNPTFQGKIVDEKFVLYPNEKKRFMNSKFGRDREAYIVVKTFRRIRSDRQNRFIHFAYAFIAQEVPGLTPEIVKELSREALLEIPIHEVVRKIMKSYDGPEDGRDQLEASLYERRLPSLYWSTAEMTVEHMRDYIEKLPPWALEEFRVQLPLPNEVDYDT